MRMNAGSVCRLALGRQKEEIDFYCGFPVVPGGCGLPVVPGAWGLPVESGTTDAMAVTAGGVVGGSFVADTGGGDGTAGMD